MLPDLFYTLVRSAQSANPTDHHFPRTLFYNEGWMLRLLLEAMQSEGIKCPYLSFEPGARWYSEARLLSPFPRRAGLPKQGEGATCADGVMGHFGFRAGTTAGLELSPGAKQFVVLEAKMGSSLSAKTTNSPTYNQAARTIACMAQTLSEAKIAPSALSSAGFYVLAPKVTEGRHTHLHVDLIRQVVDDCILAYRGDTNFDVWRGDYFEPLLDRIAPIHLKVLSWESCIDTVTQANPLLGYQLQDFYSECLKLM